MTSRAYYNEKDPFAAAWLRNLISAGVIAPGDVDERDMLDVRPAEIAGYTQVHLCAGIGVWSYSFRLAGWPDELPVWSASFPCQPFSAAGEGNGFADERHIWPGGLHLIAECRPDVIFGEQVASKDGLAWIDLVQNDLEGTDYTSAALDLCASSIGAPHIRQRLYWVAHSNRTIAEFSARIRAGTGRSQGARSHDQFDGRSAASRLDHDDNTRLERLGDGFGPAFGWDGTIRPVAEAGESSRLVDSKSVDQRTGSRNYGSPEFGRNVFTDTDQFSRLVDSDGRHPGTERQQRSGQYGFESGDCSGIVGLGHAGNGQLPVTLGRSERRNGDGSDRADIDRSAGRTGPVNGYWRNADWLFCRDERWRAVESGTFPLAHGIAGRVGRLRAYGNAIVAPLAQAFIETYIKSR